MILLEQQEEEQEEMLLPLCLTGFCYAEAGKNNDATHLKLTLESLIHLTTLYLYVQYSFTNHRSNTILSLYPWEKVSYRTLSYSFYLGTYFIFPLSIHWQFPLENKNLQKGAGGLVNEIIWLPAYGRRRTKSPLVPGKRNNPVHFYSNYKGEQK